MFRCFSGPSRSASVNEYVSLSDINDPRLETLAAGTRKGQVINVSSTTFDMMSLAHNILLKTGYETFPDGPGNQEAAIWMSGGRSWTRMKICRERTDPSDPEAKIVRGIRETGGGNCGEHKRIVAVEFQRHHRSMPVFEVMESAEHHYAIVGDWRDRRVGDHAIVVDPWQGLKKIHTYGERVNSTSPLALKTIEEGRPSRFPSELKAALSVKQASASEMDIATKNRLQIFSTGPQIARHIIRDNKPVMFDSITSTQNLHTVYRDPNGRTSAFNSIPPAYLEKYLDARESMKRELS